MPDEKAAAKADLVEQFWQNFQCLDMHVVERARQFCRRRGAIARARMDEHAGAGHGLEFFGKIAPQPGRSQAFVQHDNGRRVSGRGPDHAVFEIGGADGEEAGGCERLHDVGYPKVI